MTRRWSSLYVYELTPTVYCHVHLALYPNYCSSELNSVFFTSISGHGQRKSDRSCLRQVIRWDVLYSRENYSSWKHEQPIRYDEQMAEVIEHARVWGKKTHFTVQYIFNATVIRNFLVEENLGCNTDVYIEFTFKCSIHTYVYKKSNFLDVRSKILISLWRNLVEDSISPLVHLFLRESLIFYSIFSFYSFRIHRCFFENTSFCSSVKT